MAFYNNNQFYNPMTGYTQYGGQYNSQYNSQYNGKIYVQGEAAAKSYLVAPNASVVLWDSERPIIYEKIADMNGVPTMQKFRLVEEPSETAQNSVSATKVDYLTSEDLKAVYEQISDLRAEIDGLSIRRPTKKKEVVEDE